MGLIALKCPSCGAALELAEDRDFCFCQYCGTKVTKDKQYIELSGEVAVSGMASRESFLKRAFLFVEDGNFTEADRYFERVLDSDPETSEAYIGKLMCQLKIRKREALAGLSTPLEAYDFFNKALRFASPEEKTEYEKLCSEVSKRIENKKREALERFENGRQIRENQVGELEARIKQNSEFIQSSKAQYALCIAKRALWLILEIVSILAVAFFTVGVFAVWEMVFFDAACIVWMIAMIRKNKVAKKLTAAYDEAKAAISADSAALEDRRRELAQWMSTKPA